MTSTPDRRSSLALLPHIAAARPACPHRQGEFVLDFEVSDIVAEYERIAAIGVDWVLPPTAQPWGNRSMIFRDPAGNLVNVWEDLPVTPLPRPALPSVIMIGGVCSTVPTPALAAAEAVGLAHRVIRHGPVRSLAEAARARGVAPADVVKTLVVRRGQDDFLFVLVPGDRAISWPKLRALLGVSRLSMPDAEVARQATGYERGTITPFGSARPWPVISDERVRGREITLGAGEHGLALAANADEILRVLDAVVADISEPEPESVP